MIDDIFWASDNGHPLPRIQGIKDYSLGSFFFGKHSLGRLPQRKTHQQISLPENNRPVHFLTKRQKSEMPPTRLMEVCKNRRQTHDLTVAAWSGTAHTWPFLVLRPRFFFVFFRERTGVLAWRHARPGCSQLLSSTTELQARLHVLVSLTATRTATFLNIGQRPLVLIFEMVSHRDGRQLP